ncbi:MAG: ABC transporter ATP-binding protein [Acidobacteria bacterium]|nr:ABC transporter ATP-binding protein [Acidobacteriota bacterium]
MALELQRVVFGYDQPVIKDLSLKVEAGQLVAIAGPNGVGKTTLLRLIRGLLRAQSGSIRLDGDGIGRLSRRALAKQMGYVLQEHVVPFPLLASEYVMHGRFARGNGLAFESAADRKAVRRAMELTRTAPLAGRPMPALSGGERQRVMLARALAGEPRVLLLDEPIANMDIAFQAEMMQLVRDLTLAGGLISVLITHELNLASAFSDRLVLLRGGRVFAEGPPREVISPSNLEEVFGARFVVDTNPETHSPRITISTVKKEP